MARNCPKCSKQVTATRKGEIRALSCGSCGWYEAKRVVFKGG